MPSRRWTRYPHGGQLAFKPGMSLLRASRPPRTPLQHPTTHQSVECGASLLPSRRPTRGVFYCVRGAAVQGCTCGADRCQQRPHAALHPGGSLRPD
jgi:hypothetical protein